MRFDSLPADPVLHVYRVLLSLLGDDGSANAEGLHLDEGKPPLIIMTTQYLSLLIMNAEGLRFDDLPADSVELSTTESARTPSLGDHQSANIPHSAIYSARIRSSMISGDGPHLGDAVMSLL